MADRVRILLIDDHTLFRESLARLLEMEPEFEVVGRCATVAEGHQALAATAVDVVLLDYDLGNEVGTDLLAKLDGGRGNARVILVTAGMRASSALHAVHAGVAGIVLKHSDPRHLIEAIRKVAGGETWWDNGILQTTAAGAKDESASVRSLTERQRQVLRSILDGLSNKEIAARMQASETAIKATIQELFSKAGVRTRSQLVRVAIERYSLGWLSDETSGPASV
jgi:two-component system, NarL family, nitrate/nitrite response regulator NarL